MKQNPYWFFNKWGIEEPSPIEILSQKIQQLEDRVTVLEDENIGLTNALYEVENSLDARIDIIVDKFRTEWDV